MDIIHGTPFCVHCNSLIILPDCEPIVCRECGATVRFADSGLDRPIELASQTRENQAWARDEEEVQQQKRTTNATIDEPCPECGHPELEYYTMQLRSADEGQTVFYECPKCGHKFSQNN